MNSHLKLFAAFVLCPLVYGQSYAGDLCTIQSSGTPGICKIIEECPKVLQDLRQRRGRPQNCGYHGQNPIVCCPTEENFAPPQESTRRPPKRNRAPGQVSKRKCREYSAYSRETKFSPTLSLRPQKVERDECGHKATKLIVGGTKAERKEFPHMAALGYEPTPGEIGWFCGGTIISNRYILTAAHCLENSEQGKVIWALIGVTALNDTSDLKQLIKIRERIAHDDYRSFSHYHDIGLLKLEKPIKMSPFARPACLYLNKDVTPERAIATGWGHTTWNGDGSNDLRRVTLDLFEREFCNTAYKNHINWRLANGIEGDQQMCAGSLDEEKDTCQGDSGGPLQIYHVGDEVKCMYDIVGITSFGKACLGSPGIYIRVARYIKWIEDIVWP